MKLAAQLLRHVNDPALDYAERARRRCQLAKELEESGDYEAARDAMDTLWRCVGERPSLDGLDQFTAAEVLLRAGSLSGWIGSVGQIAGAQETAKNLISESFEIFESLQEKEKSAQALTDLAYCYWREGALDEARVTLQNALSRLGDEDGEQKAVALLRSAIVEISATRLNEALRILTSAAPLFEASSNHAIKGKFHMNLAVLLKNLGTAERRADYIDRALIEHTAAGFHLEKAGHARYLARVENNLGFLLFTIARFTEAHEHLNRARRLFTGLKETGSVAQVEETRARAFLAQGRTAEAERVARAAVLTLDKGDERSLLAEALVTHGTAQARLGRHGQARLTLDRAVSVAQRAGDIEGAGRAEIAVLEELASGLSAAEARETYERADALLAESQNVEIIKRLRACARRVLAAGRDASSDFSAPPNFFYASPQTGALLRDAYRVAGVPGSVLIAGETGTGKELLARLMHDWSGRAGQFVHVNCAALDDSSLASQLFGHAKNASSDRAAESHLGAARRAARGTLFLDEIAELSLSNQGRLLRLIEHGEIHRVGAAEPERIDVRIIVATSRDLRALVATGQFRKEIYYRLETFRLEIPPLRERPEDIAAIAAGFIKGACQRHDKHVTFTPDALDAMRQLPLMGNVRELCSLIERAVVAADDEAVITGEAVRTATHRQAPEANPAAPWSDCSLDDEVLGFEGHLIKLALEAAKGSITQAARMLGITHQRLALMLGGRHKNLLAARTPMRQRKRSVIATPQRKTPKAVKTGCL